MLKVRECEISLCKGLVVLRISALVHAKGILASWKFLEMHLTKL